MLLCVAIDTSYIIDPTHFPVSGVIVVPSFEADQNQNPPATKAELDECMSAKRCRGVLEVGPQRAALRLRLN